MREITIGPTPPISFLPFDKAGNILKNVTHFILERKMNIRDDGCHSEPLCGDYNPCKNAAVCRDLWNLRVCNCRPGFTGSLCQVG